MTKVGIIVLNWEKPELTIDTINSLLKLTHLSFTYQIYLVDNGSSDDSINRFENIFKYNKLVTLLSTHRNLGFVGGNNFGLNRALTDKCSYFLIINNDVYIKPNFLENLICFSHKHPSVGIMGPKIYFAKGHEFHHQNYSKSQLGKILWSAGGQMDWDNILGSNIGVDQYDRGQYDRPNYNVDFLSGCCLLITLKVIQKIGLLDEKYFMYLEDTDYCQRALRNDFQIAYVPKSVIWHINAGSSASGSNLHDYYITRNRLLFSEKYSNLRARISLIRESIKFLLLPTKRKAVVDYYLRRFGKGSL